MQQTLTLFFVCVSVAAAQAPPVKELASVSGRITAPGGQPLRKSTVTLRPTGRPLQSGGAAGQSMQPYGATTDADGKFTFDGVEAGTYMVMAEHTGYVRSTYSVRKTGLNGSSLVNLAPGQHMTGIDIEMPAQSTVSGRVVDEDGEPAGRAQVRLMRRMYMNMGRRQLVPVGNAITDENGEFKMTGLAAGRYLLSVSPAMNGMGMEAMRRAKGEQGKPEEGPVTTYYPGTTDAGAATALELTAGQDAGGVNVRMLRVRTFHVRGKATGAISAETAPRLRITAAPRNSVMMFNAERSAQVEKDGSFDIGGLPPGSYSVAAMRMEGMVFTMATANVNVGNEDVEGVVLNAVETGELPGIVRIEGGESQTPAPDPSKPGQAPRASMQVALTNQDFGAMVPGGGTAPAKEDGSFKFARVGPGVYRVSVMGMPMGAYVKSVRWGGRETIDTGLDLTQGTAGTLEILVSPKGGDVSGAVQDHDGKPSSGLVALVPDGGADARPDLYRQANADDSGQFHMRGVPPGRYRIYAFGDIEPGAQFDPEFLRLHENEGQRVSVEESGSQQITLVR